MCATPCPQGTNPAVFITIKKKASDENKLRLSLSAYTDGKIHEFYLIEGQKNDEHHFSLMSLENSKYELDEGSAAVFDFEQGTVELKLLGNNCEQMTFSRMDGKFDDTQRQLDNGIHPLEIYQELVDKGTPPELALKRFYGKKYKEGLIFYLNAEEGTGLIAATSDQSDNEEWGCESLYSEINAGLRVPEGEQINDGQANTKAIWPLCQNDGGAAKLCREFGQEWFLPSKKELDLMFTNLHLNGHGDFAATNYWSSTGAHPIQLAWALDFGHNHQNLCTLGSRFHVRAAKAF